MKNQSLKEKISCIYEWFNEISDPATPFQKEQLELHFTPDFVMQMNDEILCFDMQSLYVHFQDFRESGSYFNMVFPFHEIIVSDDGQKCIVRYHITVRKPDQEIQTIKVIAIWHLAQDGRLGRMNEVAVVE